MKKNKWIYIILLFVLVASLVAYLTKKDNNTPSLSDQINERLSAYTTDLEDSIVSIGEDTDVVQYLCNWADSKNLSFDVSNDTTVIFSVADSTANKAVGSDFVVVCEYDSKNMNECVNQISTSLTIAKCAPKGSPLKIIFTPRQNGNASKLQQSLKSLLTENTQIICLGSSSENTLSTLTGGLNSQTISKEIKYVKPQFTKAYKISVSGLPETYFTESQVMQPNPIKTLGNLLAHFMSSQKLCELADINGSGMPNTTVASASATIVFDEESLDSFNEELESFVESFTDKYVKDYPDLIFSYEEVDCPDKVVSSEDYEDIVGFLYSCTDGVYKRDSDGRILAMSNINSIKLSDSTFSLDIEAYGYSKEGLDELIESNGTFASLIGLTFEEKLCTPIFDGSIISDSLVELLQSGSKELGPKLNFAAEPTSNLTCCSYIFEKYSNLPMVYISFNEDGRNPLCKKIVTLVSSDKNNIN